VLKYQNFLQHCSLFFQQNYFAGPTNYFQICIQQNFRSLKIVLSVYRRGQLWEKSPSVNPICVIDWRRRLTNRRLNVVVEFLKVAIKWRASRRGNHAENHGESLDQRAKEATRATVWWRSVKTKGHIGFSRLDDGAVDRQPVTKAREYVCIRMHIFACTVQECSMQTGNDIPSEYNNSEYNMRRMRAWIYDNLFNSDLWNFNLEFSQPTREYRFSILLCISIKNSQSSNFYFNSMQFINSSS